MLSFFCNSARGKPSLLCLAQLLFVTLCLRSIHGATLRAHRLRESESDPSQSPNADMIKALEYIESLRQKTDSQEKKPLLPTGNDGRHLDDAQKMRAMLRIAPNPTSAENDDEEDDTDEERSEDKSEELLQAVLSTLQQTEKASKPTLLRPSSLVGTNVKDGMYPRVQKQRGSMLHKKMPLMFEDDEEGEGDEEEEEDHESPFKRTNENVEEKYTPQNLATLQSVFDELDKFSNDKPAHKRRDEEDGVDEEEEEEGEDLFSLRNVVYDDEGEDLTDWGPLEQQGEEEEEDEDDKRELDRSLDYVDEEEEQDEDGDERYPVTRSDDPDQVDYYLFKVLEKTEEEEQKRAIEEEESKRAERRVAQYRDNIDPQVIFQLIQISQKYQIPPEDLLDMLKTGETTSQGKTQKSRDQNKLWQMSSKKTYKIPPTKFYNRRLPARKSSPKNLQTEAILNILGLRNMQNRDQTPVRKPYGSSASQLHALAAGRTGDVAPTQRRFPPGTSKDYDDTADGELAAYLAAQMLARYPGPAYRYGKAGQKRDEAGQSAAGSFEQAMQDYLDQTDSNEERNKKRRSEDGERDGNTQANDNEAVMKLMRYLNPEIEDSESEAKAGHGI
ncbi:secretogranin-2a [Phyllopteryx taeniolatus]|uniref:secretogranin-2a n=1 Tax=Phyllopteryx taeniolatus TaxID=161469 RepID=UPI002AD4B8D8|nr:secretogranin-2a [Phyllopteryx taeniolatus]